MNYKQLMSMLERVGVFRWVPTKIFLQKKYKRITGKALDLNNPKSYTEKLQWLKIYYANNFKSEYTVMADKVLAKDFVLEKIPSGGYFNTDHWSLGSF